MLTKKTSIFSKTLYKFLFYSITFSCINCFFDPLGEDEYRTEALGSAKREGRGGSGDRVLEEADGDAKGISKDKYYRESYIFVV